VYEYIVVLKLYTLQLFSSPVDYARELFKP